MTDDINTVTISARLATDVQTYHKEDLTVARFLVDVPGSGETRKSGTFKVVAFGDRAEYARENLKEGDSIILLGTLWQRRSSRGGQNIEIHARTILSASPEPLEQPARD